MVRLGDDPGAQRGCDFAPDAAMIGHIALPERCANLCFGGPKRNRLFMAASQSDLLRLRKHSRCRWRLTRYYWRYW